MNKTDAIKSPVVSLPDAMAELGGISRTGIYHLLDRGELHRVNVGRRAFITRKSLDAFWERLDADASAQLGGDAS